MIFERAFCGLWCGGVADAIHIDDYALYVCPVCGYQWKIFKKYDEDEKRKSNPHPMED